MTKSTFVVIFIIYLVSIVLIGFFGTSVKVYDPTRYVKSIEMAVESEDDRIYTFESEGKDAEQNNTYVLSVDYSSFHKIDEDNEEYLNPISLIPNVTYDSGDKGVTEPITFSLRNADDYVENGYIDLDEHGTLRCFAHTDSILYFHIVVSPTNPGRLGNKAIIEIVIF